MKASPIKIAVLGVTLALAAIGTANAAGCLKGAVVGGVAGHYAGHHAVVGALAAPTPASAAPSAVAAPSSYQLPSWSQQQLSSHSLPLRPLVQQGDRAFVPSRLCPHDVNDRALPSIS